jgi:transposase
MIRRSQSQPLWKKAVVRVYSLRPRVVEALTYLTDLVADHQTTIRDLRELMFPASTEKTEAVLKKAGVEPSSKAGTDKAGASKPEARKQKPPGHGRNGAEAYRNAGRVKIQHASLKHGDRCPGCLKGKVYEQREPRRLVRIVGQAPLTATVYELQSLRCNLCGEIYGTRMHQKASGKTSTTKARQP